VKETPNSTALPDRPGDLGAVLRRMREEKEVSIEKIVEETKVSRRVFEALESGSYEHLPQRVFCRNFLRQYSIVIGIEPDGVLEAFDRAWARFEMSSGSFAALEVPDSVPRRVIRWWLFVPLALGLAVSAVLGLMMVRSCHFQEKLQRDPRRSPVTAPETPTALFSSPTPVLDREPPAIEDDETKNEDVRIEISVLPGKECWMRYRDRQGGMGQFLLRNGEKKTLELPQPVLLTLGNGHAARVRLNDREKEGGFGDPGQVVHLEINEEGLKMLENSGSNGG